MLSWIARKLLLFKKKMAVKKTKNRKSAAVTLSRWHLACQWLARAVDGVDMILEPTGSIFVVSKAGSSFNGHVVVSKATVSGVRCHLAVNMVADRGVEAFEYKAIDGWSEDLAKLVASLIALKEKPEPNLDPPESMWGIWAYGREMLFPHFKSEEEMFMTMALDGVAIDEKDI